MILHGCTLEDDTLVGMGSIVMNGARIRRGSEGYEVMPPHYSRALWADQGAAAFPPGTTPPPELQAQERPYTDYPHGTFVDYSMHAYDDDVPLATLQDTPPVAT